MGFPFIPIPTFAGIFERVIRSNFLSFKKHHDLEWSTSNFENFDSLLTAIGDEEAIIVVNSTVTLTANTTAPANVTIRDGGGVFANGSYTMTFNGPFEWGLRQAFTGAVAIIFSKVLKIIPEWFGAAGDGITDDSSAIQATLYSVGDNYDLGDGGVPEIILTSKYLCNSGLTVPTRVNLVGSRSHVSGNLNRNAARLIFTGLGTNTKALTIGSDIRISGLVISGPGESVSGSYGIYGGELASEGLGSNTQIIDCTIEDFETPVILSRWINVIENCAIDDAITAIDLRDRANHTVIRNNRLNPGNASPKVCVAIDGQIEGVFISENNIESIYYGIVVIRGQGIDISRNRFEIINKCAIDVRGDSSANDEEIYVDIHDNFILDYGSSASSSGRYGILIQAGHATIDDNTIKRYDSGSNLGLQYGINFGGAGVIESCLIGKNNIDCYQAIANINDTATREKIHSRFTHLINYRWDLDVVDAAGGAAEVFFPLQTPTGYRLKLWFEKLRYYNVFDLDDIPTGIYVGHRGTSLDIDYFMTALAPSSVSDGTVGYADDGDWTSVGKTFIDFDVDKILMLRVENGTALTGTVQVTLTVNEFRY